MQRKMKTACLLAGAMLATVPGVTHAQTSELEQMQAEMAQMRAEIAQLRAEQQGDWLNDARRAEIEGMIADVFADANNRATLLQEGALAGIDEKGKIFLMSSDGGFTANFKGQIQTRYIWNSLDTDSGRTESLSGLQMSRVEFGVKGKVGDGWGYEIKLKTKRDSGPGGGDTGTKHALIIYKINDSWSMQAGVKELPFARQELISSSRQVAVDRSLVTEFFTLNRSEHVAFMYGSDTIKGAVALSDGGNRDFTDFNNDVSNDFAVTGRLDWMAMGDDWGAMKHEFGGVDEDALFLGVAGHYEVAEGSAAPNSGFAWTADALYKTGPLGLTAAFFGNHTENVGGTDSDQYGLYAQASYDLRNDWDVFGRWEYIDDDGVSAAATDELQAVTVGVNHHFNKNVKFTADVVYIYAGDAPSADGNFIYGGALSDGLGLGSDGFSAADDHDDQIALRLQLQLVF